MKKYLTPYLTKLSIEENFRDFFNKNISLEIKSNLQNSYFWYYDLDYDIHEKPIKNYYFDNISFNHWIPLFYKEILNNLIKEKKINIDKQITDRDCFEALNMELYNVLKELGINQKEDFEKLTNKNSKHLLIDLVKTIRNYLSQEKELFLLTMDGYIKIKNNIEEIFNSIDFLEESKAEMNFFWESEEKATNNLIWFFIWDKDSSEEELKFDITLMYCYINFNFLNLALDNDNIETIEVINNIPFVLSSDEINETNSYILSINH